MDTGSLKSSTTLKSDSQFSIDHGLGVTESRSFPTVRDEISRWLLDIQQRRRRLDEEELRCKRLWNASLLVTRLPNEITVAIFRYFTDASDFYSIRFRRRPAWMPFMGVCQYWRDVALSTSSLWTDITIRRRPGRVSEDLLSLFLSRSSTAPLTVVFVEPSEAVFTLLVPHLHRVRQLCVVDISLEDVSSYTTLLPHYPMPLLTDLELGCVRVPRDSQAAQQSLSLSHADYPLLSLLTLCGMSIPHDPQIYENLRSLTLRNRCAYKLNFEQFLDTLSACSRLDSLTLRAFLYQFDLPDRDSLPPWRLPITLASLTSLELKDEYPEDSSPFLAHIILPPRASLLIEVAIDPPAPDASILQESLTQSLPPNPSGTAPILSSLAYAALWTDHDEYRLYGSTDADDMDMCHPGVSLTLSLHSFQDWSRYLPMGLSDLLWIFGVARQLAVLSITGNLNTVHALRDPVRAWGTLWVAFPMLEVLRVWADGGRILPFFDALRAASAPPISDELALPRLRELHVMGSDRHADAEPVELDNVVGCLADRAARGARLRMLRFGIAHSSDPGDEYTYEACKARYVPQLETVVDTVRYENIGRLSTLGYQQLQ